MSNPLAVPAVTAALVTLVQAAVDTLGLTPGPVVTARGLDDSGDQSRVGVHLFRVSRNENLANEELPVRSSGGVLRAPPTVALDLHYLVCFRSDTDLEAQQMLAVSAVTIEANPLVGDDLLTVAEASHTGIVGNDLRDSPVRARLCAGSLSVDELTKIWALYPAGSFGLTLAVTAGPVLIEAAAQPVTGLPVQSITLGAAPLTPLRLDVVGGPDGPGAPVRATSPMPGLDLVGAGFTAGAGESVVAVIDGAEVAPLSASSTHLAVPAAGLAPGPHRVQVRRIGPPLSPAHSPTPTAVTSEVRVVTVVPTLIGATTTASGIKVTHHPEVKEGDRVRLLLDPVSGGSSVAVAAGSLAAAPADAVTFGTDAVSPGTYRLTLEIDGARSIPALDASGHYVHTEVTL